jgi:signal peptidase I
VNLHDPGFPTDEQLVEEEPASQHKKSSGFKALVEWVLVIGGALLLAMLIRTFLLAAFFIPSGSMIATLNEGDRVLVNKLSYNLHDINRGDIVVFERPPNEPDTGIKDLIKRVIGLPGDVVEARDGRVVINGRYLDEPYVHCPTPGELTCTDSFEGKPVPEGELFVMGDNRTASSDSRVFGTISADLVVGRAFVKVWPLNDISWL